MQSQRPFVPSEVSRVFRPPTLVCRPRQAEWRAKARVRKCETCEVLQDVMRTEMAQAGAVKTSPARFYCVFPLCGTIPVQDVAPRYFLVLKTSRYGIAERPSASLKFSNFSLLIQMAYVFPGSSFTGSTQVRLSARYLILILSSTFGKLSSETVAHDHDPSCMSLLKVTLISVNFGSTSALPACGTVFTTTGGTDSRVTSSARTATAAMPPKRATRAIAMHFFMGSSPRFHRRAIRSDD